MTVDQEQGARRENDYLKLRCSQLQEDVAALSAQVTRLQQELERVAGRRTTHRANPLSGGQ
jgi:hypothetical protein